MKSEKVAVFIDGNYLKRLLSRQNIHVEDLDLKLSSDLLCAGCYRFRTYYYDGTPHADFKDKNEIEKFQESLKTLPRFVVRLGRVLKSERGYRQKGVDVLLAIDLTEISVSRAIDRAILVISDTDYIPAIRKARDNFTLVTLYHFDEPNFSRKLKYECDECLQIPNDLIMKVKK